MLTRYRIYRGKRPADDPLPDGVRQDTRKHTGHVLRPPADLVARFLDDPTNESWRSFERDYLGVLEKRFADSREEFDRLAELTRSRDVYLGCNCPTKKNPDVRRCHTVLALRFMASRYTRLEIVLPGGAD